LPEEHVEGGQRELAIPNRTELLTQILSGIQNINTRIDRIEDTLHDIQRH